MYRWQHPTNAAESSLLDQAGVVFGILGVLAGIAFSSIQVWREVRKSRQETSSNRAASGDVAVRPPDSAGLSPVRRSGSAIEFFDRDDERRTLETRLLDESGGVIVVTGVQGVGKSALVGEVLSKLRGGAANARSGPVPQVFEHDTLPGSGVGIGTLIADLENSVGGPATPGALSWSPAFALDQFTTSLEALGHTPLVIVIDDAENLLDTESGQLLDRDLDEAFETLATDSRHRVKVVLVTRIPPVSTLGRTWPNTRYLEIKGFPAKKFAGYLAELGGSGDDGLARALQRLDGQLQGNPRLAQLAHGVLVSRRYPASLAKELQNEPAQDFAKFLTTQLVESLGPVGLRVLQVLDAYGTPVDATMVSELLDDRHFEEEVRDTLDTLVARHAIHTTSDGRYYLPPSEGEWLVPGEARWVLLSRAGAKLAARKPDAVRSIEDLRFHFAELRAVMRADMPDAAYLRLKGLDVELRQWNCGYLLLQQRQALQGRLYDQVDAMDNENALGQIHASLGHFTEASQAYGEALRHAEALHDRQSRTRIRVNLAGAYWWNSDVDHAYNYYSLARDDCDELFREDPERYGDLLPIWMAALEGLADCHRHWGRYDRAVQHARQALEIPQKPQYPTHDEARIEASRSVGIAMKLARWHVDLGDVGGIADGFADLALREVDERGEEWLEASCSAGRAGLCIQRRAFSEAIVAADRAVRLALRFGDPITLLQARTALCAAHLLDDEPDLIEAARQIKEAARYRRPGGSFEVLALNAIVASAQPGPDGGDEATTMFTRLLEETEHRVRHDAKDVTALEYQGFAMCALRLHSEDGLDAAIDRFQTARRQITPPAPNAVAYLILLLERLEQYGGAPGRLRPVIQELSAARTPPASA